MGEKGKIKLHERIQSPDRSRSIGKQRHGTERAGDRNFTARLALCVACLSRDFAVPARRAARLGSPPLHDLIPTPHPPSQNTTFVFPAILRLFRRARHRFSWEPTGERFPLLGFVLFLFFFPPVTLLLFVKNPRHIPCSLIPPQSSTRAHGAPHTRPRHPEPLHPRSPTELSSVQDRGGTATSAHPPAGDDSLQ